MIYGKVPRILRLHIMNAIQLKHVTKAYKLYHHPGDRLKEALHPGRKKYHQDFCALRDISLAIQPGETIGIIGRNGSGKSTLLKILMGELEADAGSYEWGYETYPEYFSQDHHESIPANTTPYEFLYSVDPGASIGTIRGLLGNFLFPVTMCIKTPPPFPVVKLPACCWRKWCCKSRM